MITMNFIIKVKLMFEELGIEVKKGITFEDFQKGFIKSLNRCDELGDAKIAITCYRYCMSKWKKIEKIFDKHLSKWQECDCDLDRTIQTISDEDSEGVYYVTNAFAKNRKEVILTSKSLDDNIIDFQQKHGKIMIDNCSDYYIKYSKMNAGKMKIYDRENNHLSDIVLSNTFEIFLENNKTGYDLVINRDNENNPFIGVFEKSYIDSLGDKDYIEFKNMVADIEWDILDRKSDIGISKINIYKELEDISQIVYFATATFLIYNSFMTAQKNRSMYLAQMSGVLTCRNLTK